MKNPSAWRWTATASFVALACAAAWLPSTQSQAQALVQAAPNFVPIGVATNGNSSTAWFHEPLTGRAMACTTAPAAGGLAPIQCVTTKLPRAEP